jgi:hypothetical protein
VKIPRDLSGADLAKSLRVLVGTLSAILKEVARHHELTVEALLEKIGIQA